MQKPMAITEITVPIPTMPPRSQPKKVTDNSIRLRQMPIGILVFLARATIKLSLGPAPKAVLI